MKTIFRLLILVLMFTLLGCEGDEYRKLMEPALKAKLADKNPHPVFDGEEEPPIPTEKELNDSFLGVDKNKNGIRDDIDIWINRTGKNYNERMAMRQLARADQDFVKAAVEKRESDAERLWNKSEEASYCIAVIFPSGEHKGINRIMRFKLRTLLASSNKMAVLLIRFGENITKTGVNRWGRHEDKYRFCEFKIENQEVVIKRYIESF